MALSWLGANSTVVAGGLFVEAAWGAGCANWLDPGFSARNARTRAARVISAALARGPRRTFFFISTFQNACLCHPDVRGKAWPLCLFPCLIVVWLPSALG